MAITKAERLAEFLRRLKALPPVPTAEEAFETVARTLNAVEDELTDIPNNPTAWQSDGRMYPPQIDSRRDIPDFPNVTRYRSRSHNTFIAANGAVEILTTEGFILLSKPGADGRSVWGR